MGEQQARGAARALEARPLATFPITIGPTSARRHVTGLFALNIPNAPLSHGGDWHQSASWFTSNPKALEESALTNEREYEPLLNRLGKQGLRDARAGLQRLNHPAAGEKNKVWAATFDRAALELAWHALVTESTISRNGVGPPVDPRELARWLLYPHQWLRLHWLAQLVRRDLEGHALKRWDQWRRSWSPWK